MCLQLLPHLLAEDLPDGLGPAGVRQLGRGGAREVSPCEVHLGLPHQQPHHLLTRQQVDICRFVIVAMKL